MVANISTWLERGLEPLLVPRYLRRGCKRGRENSSVALLGLDHFRTLTRAYALDSILAPLRGLETAKQNGHPCGCPLPN